MGFAVALVASSACDDKAGKASGAASGAPSTGAAPSAPGVASAASTGAATAPDAASSAASPAASAPAPTAITAQHVLVAYKGASKAPAGVVRSKAEAKKRAEEVADKAKSGADFSALVAEYSDDPAAKERQGSVGKFTRDKMAKAFSDAAFALGVDQTSAPVETPFGFHVIKRNQ
jgi:parvulin-like peptidyl-prolyl isomerase